MRAATLSNLITGLLGAGAMILFSLFGLVRTVQLWSYWQAFSEGGQPAQAEVLRLDDNYPWGSNYRVTYAVEIDGQPLEQQERVNRRRYLMLSPGAQIDVLTLNDPPRAVIVGNTDQIVRFTVTSLLAFFGSVGLAIFLWITLRRFERLQRALQALEITSARDVSPPGRLSED